MKPMLPIISLKKISATCAMAVFITFASSFSSHLLADDFRSQLLKAADKEANGDYVRKRFLTLLKKSFDTDTKKKALIIGDSHAQDFVNMVFEGGHMKDYQIRTRHIPTACQPVLGGTASQPIAAKNKSLCATSDSLLKAKTQIGSADLIILVANWTDWSAKTLPKTLEKLGLHSQQKLLVIGRKNFGKVSVRKFLRMPEKKLRNFRNKVDANQETINSIMRESLDPAIFVDTHKLVCDSPLSCRVFTSDLQLISFDGGHLTKSGARYVGNILFNQSQLNRL